MYTPCNPPMFDSNGSLWSDPPVPILTLFFGSNEASPDTTDYTGPLELGSEANMTFVKGTIDTYACSACKVAVNNFVKGDTLLGEHIYRTYNI